MHRLLQVGTLRRCHSVKKHPVEVARPERCLPRRIEQREFPFEDVSVHCSAGEPARPRTSRLLRIHQIPIEEGQRLEG